jgi:hypothetical protein
MDRILREGKKYLEKSGGTSKKGASGRTSSSGKRGFTGKRGGDSVADRAKRAAREFFK